MQRGTPSVAAAGTARPLKRKASGAKYIRRAVNSDERQRRPRQTIKSVMPSHSSVVVKGTADTETGFKGVAGESEALQVEAAGEPAAAASSDTLRAPDPDVQLHSPAVVQALPSMDTNENAPAAVPADKQRQKKKRNPQQQQQQQPNKKKKKFSVCPVWQAVVHAMKKKDPAAAWAQYQSNKAQYDFNVHQLQALAGLFLGASLLQPASVAYQCISAYCTKQGRESEHFLIPSATTMWYLGTRQTMIGCPHAAGSALQVWMIGQTIFSD